MSTNLEHDPAFPYVVLFGEYVAAKFPGNANGKKNAESYAERAAGTLVDTTPLEDGYYYKPGANRMYAVRGAVISHSRMNAGETILVSAHPVKEFMNLVRQGEIQKVGDL